MPKPNIYSQVLNLSQVDVYRNDIGNVDNYFTIDGLPTNLSYGKHSFSISYNNPVDLPHLKNNSKIINFTVELPPKNQRADISCNAAMILAKANNNSSIKLAEILKKHLLSNFIEFKSIEIAGPGFLNIYLHISFWKKYLTKIIQLNSKYGSKKMLKKK